MAKYHWQVFPKHSALTKHVLQRNGKALWFSTQTEVKVSRSNKTAGQKSSVLTKDSSTFLSAAFCSYIYFTRTAQVCKYLSRLHAYPLKMNFPLNYLLNQWSGLLWYMVWYTQRSVSVNSWWMALNQSLGGNKKEKSQIHLLIQKM